MYKFLISLFSKPLNKDESNSTDFTKLNFGTVDLSSCKVSVFRPLKRAKVLA